MFSAELNWFTQAPLRLMAAAVIGLLAVYPMYWHETKGDWGGFVWVLFLAIIALCVIGFFYGLSLL